MLIVRLKESGIIILQVFLWKEGFMSINDGKHLSLEDRIHIENNIGQGKKNMKQQTKYKKVNQQSEKKLENTDNVGIHKLMTLHGCVNILMSVKFALANAKVLKKSHALEEIVLLVHVIIVQTLKRVKKPNIFIMQKSHRKNMNTH